MSDLRISVSVLEDDWVFLLTLLIKQTIPKRNHIGYTIGTKVRTMYMETALCLLDCVSAR